MCNDPAKISCNTQTKMKKALLLTTLFPHAQSSSAMQQCTVILHCKRCKKNQSKVRNNATNENY